jgi:hypothetical protein
MSGSLFQSAMKGLVWLLLLANPWLAESGAAGACFCKQTSPAEGFGRAQYVFTAKVVQAGSHTWTVEVDRVWKGRDTLRRSARLMDAYAAIDCEFFFKLGERYLFYAVVAKTGRDVFYHPQVCNWTSQLQSKRVPAPDGASLWLEDLIVREHGPGEPPKDEPASMRLP